MKTATPLLLGLVVALSTACAEGARDSVDASGDASPSRGR